MAIDFSKPATTDNYSTVFVPGIVASTIALAQWLDSANTTITGTPPTFAKRYNRTATLFDEFNGSAWAELPLAYLKLAGGTMSGLLGTPLGIRVNGPATLPAATLGGWLSFENPVIREYIGDGTGYSRVWSKRNASVTTDLMTLQDNGRLTIASLNSIAAFGASTVAGSLSAYYQGGTTTPVGYTGTDGGALITGGTGLNFGIRAESSLYLLSAAGAKLLVFDSAGTLYPNVTNSYSFGSTSNRWSNVASVLGDFSGALIAASLSASGNVTAVSFSGAGTGLTGTAAGLSIGGSASSATTAANVAGTGAATVATLTATGVLKGNGGAKGYGAITTTVTTGTPTGGTSGDFVLVY